MGQSERIAPQWEQSKSEKLSWLPLAQDRTGRKVPWTRRLFFFFFSVWPQARAPQKTWQRSYFKGGLLESHPTERGGVAVRGATHSGFLTQPGGENSAGLDVEWLRVCWGSWPDSSKHSSAIGREGKLRQELICLRFCSHSANFIALALAKHHTWVVFLLLNKECSMVLEALMDGVKCCLLYPKTARLEQGTQTSLCGHCSGWM